MIKLLFKGLAPAFDFFANALTVAGGLVGVVAITNPETVAAYLEKISGDVGVIAQSIPRWPVIHDVEFIMDRPSLAALSVELANPRNIVVEDFKASAIFSLQETSIQVVLDGASMIPPNEEVALSANVIRKPWFPAFERQEEVDLRLCFSGQLEGEKEPFFETRAYSLHPEFGKLKLTGREFSSEQLEVCNG